MCKFENEKSYKRQSASFKLQAVAATLTYWGGLEACSYFGMPYLLINASSTPFVQPKPS
jgi:hypothetical protein